MLEALNIVDQDFFFRVTGLMEQQDAAGGLALVEDLMSRGYDLREFLVGLIEHFRNLLVAKVTGKSDLIQASDVMRKRYEEVAGLFSIGDLLRAQRHVGTTEMSIQRTAQARFRLEADIVQLVTMPRAVDLVGLIEGLEEIKKKLPGDAAVVLPSPSTPRPVMTPAAASVPATVVPPATPPRPRPVAAPASATPHSPPHRTPVNEAEVRSRWTEFVTEVSRAKISVGTVLGSTTLLGVQDGIVRVGCVDEFQVASVERNRDVLSEMFYTIFRVRVGIAAERIIRPAADDNAGAAPEEEHPIITALKRELGAEPI
jgi:DNA polymerase-3 subunit gamma/tau